MTNALQALRREPPMAEQIDMRALLINKEEHTEQAARAINAMSHPLRLKILCDHEVRVQNIVERVGTSQSSVSQHLACYC